MRRILFLIGALATLAVVLPSVLSQSEPAKKAAPAAAAGQEEGKTRPAADHSADEEAIRANVARFVKAYNAGDAKAVAALFTPDGEIVDKEGNDTEGRDDGGSSVVYSSCRWSDDKNVLLQDFRLQLNGQNAMNVSQRIGWDPVAKQIHSWVFDSEGGFGESLWTRDGDGWIIQATGIRPDGTTASATNQLVPAGRDGYLWRSANRLVAGERQPAMEVKIVRKPPQPKQ